MMRASLRDQVSVCLSDMSTSLSWVAVQHYLLRDLAESLGGVLRLLPARHAGWRAIEHVNMGSILTFKYSSSFPLGVKGSVLFLWFY